MHLGSALDLRIWQLAMRIVDSLGGFAQFAQMRECKLSAHFRERRTGARR